MEYGHIHNCIYDYFMFQYLTYNILHFIHSNIFCTWYYATTQAMSYASTKYILKSPFDIYCVRGSNILSNITLTIETFDEKELN